MLNPCICLLFLFFYIFSCTHAHHIVSMVTTCQERCFTLFTLFVIIYHHLKFRKFTTALLNVLNEAQKREFQHTRLSKVQMFSKTFCMMLWKQISARPWVCPAVWCFCSLFSRNQKPRTSLRGKQKDCCKLNPVHRV